MNEPFNETNHESAHETNAFTEALNESPYAPVKEPEAVNESEPIGEPESGAEALPAPRIEPADLASLDALRELSDAECESFYPYLQLAAAPAGKRLLREGSRDREMFFLLDGEVSVSRGGLQLGRMAAGAHAGELSLISGRPRSATIQTETETELAWLSLASYEQLQAEQPALALKLQQALIRQLGLQLTDITDRFGHLLQERSLPRRMELTVRVGERSLEIATGTPVAECLPTSVAGEAVVAAMMDNRIVGLSTPVVSEVALSPLTSEHWEGQRVLRRSAGLLLLEAANQLHPQLKLSAALSMGSTQWFQTGKAEPVDWEGLAAELQALLDDMINREQPFREEVWSTEEAIQYFEEAGRSEALELLRSSARNHVTMSSCGAFYVISSSPLVPHAGYLSGLRVAVEPQGLALLTAADGPSLKAMEAYAQTMKHHNLWLKSLGAQSVGQINKLAIQGEVARLIQVAEGFHEKRLGQIADRIAASAGKLSIVCIAGPSSSGKTTFIHRLSVQLLVNGLNPVALSLDDYYANREHTPLDQSGAYDYESLYALDLPLLTADLERLLGGEPVATARYDFAAGRSLPGSGPRLQLATRDVLLLEGIHGLNPALFGPDTDQSRIFRIFIQPMTSLALDEHARINPSDLRLLRRIVRDRYQRATTAADNIARWPSVRAGEQKWIFPYVDQADELFDSSLVYELQVIKVFAERYLLEVPRDHTTYATAHRLHQLIQPFVAIYPDHVPQNSLLREFIMGT